jgi:hypothetical protein
MEAFSFEAPEVAQGHLVGPDALLAAARPPRFGTDAASRYRICGLLGAGGMGLIYEAIHLALDTTVAIKVLRPEFVVCVDLTPAVVQQTLSARRSLLPCGEAFQDRPISSTPGSASVPVSTQR